MKVQQYVQYTLGDKMKLNNKGMTLMELLISIVLIGMVLVFLMQLLTDLRDETDNNNFAYNNQVNRTEVIYTIEKDLNKYTLVGLEDASSNGNIVIKFHFRKGVNEIASAILTSSKEDVVDELGLTKTKYYLSYTDYNGEKYLWEMKNAILDSCGYFTYYLDNNSNNYYFKLNFYIYNNPTHERNNENKNNAVDDIEITYTEERENLIINNGNYLTGNEKTEKKVGYCTN